MEESTLVKTFEMLVDRLGRVEAKQLEVLQALKEADEAKGDHWVPGRMHCGLPVRIYKHMQVPVTCPDRFVEMEIQMKGDSLENRPYHAWINGKKSTFDPTVFAPEVRAALQRVRDDQEIYNLLGAPYIYDPTCEDLGLSSEGPDLEISAFVSQELARQSCKDACEILSTNGDSFLMRFPKASEKEPVWLADIMRVCVMILDSFGASLAEVGCVKLRCEDMSLLPLYRALQRADYAQDFELEEATRIYKALPRCLQINLTQRVCADEHALFRPWMDDLHAWMHEGDEDVE